ncbi:LysM peptidoglycan-binding domain-containing protein [Streptacidiphilus carbonis]|uniref:LysM peptidoglycan-binding domain-containing protein n=1 Tax=Streptacidiphilus carbonis TaxID=105422 RepID=UPI000694995C|nr:LysM peptidoglycan-binding domain-containing protein [Streptacidiphilus carbonis]
MTSHARHRRPSGGRTPRTALVIAAGGATAALPILGAAAAQASPPAPAHTSTTDRAAVGSALVRAVAPAGRSVVHTVRPGESLSLIARELQATGGWKELYAENRATVGADPDLIRPGQRLLVPVGGSPTPKPAAAAPAPATTSSGTATATGTKSSTTAAPAAAMAPADTAAPSPAVAATVPATGSTPKPDGVSGSWTLAFDDEFNGTALDRTKWNTGWFGSGVTAPVSSSEQQCYDPARVSVHDGTLHLDATATSEQCGGGTKRFSSGMVTTNGLHQFTDGFFEAGIYLPAAPDGSVADWPAWWTDGQSWPADGEMDIMEGLSGSTCFHYHDPSGGPGGCANVGPGRHTFGADRENGKVTYYYDGHDVGTTSTGGVTAPQYLILNNAVGGAGGTSAPADLQVDDVRVWTRG